MFKVSASATASSVKELTGCDVFIQGELKVANSAFDEMFNMRAAGQPLLERKVEVLCFDDEKARA